MDTLLERLRAVDTTTLSDAGKQLRVMDGGLRPLRTGLKLLGRAIPVAARDDLMPALRRGLAGIVIDGACRDTNQLRELALPFYARGVSPRAHGATAVPGEPETVRCGGVEVAPGDVLVGDDDGIVVGSPEELAAVLDAAEALQATEASMLASIQAGESLFSRLDYEEHLARLRAGEESSLSFL